MEHGESKSVLESPIGRGGDLGGDAIAATGPPTKEHLSELYEALPSLWAGRNERIAKVRSARKHLAGIRMPPEAAKLTNLEPPEISLVGDLITRTQGLWMAQLPLPQRHALNPSDDREVRAAENVERGLSSLYAQLFGWPNNVYAQATDAFPMDGQAVWKIGLDNQLFFVRKEKGEGDERYLERVKHTRREHIPFWAEHVDTPMYFPAGHDRLGLTEVMEISEREIGPLFDQFGEKVDWQMGSGHWGETGTFLEYCNRDHVAYWLKDKGEPLIIPHKYKRVNYFDPLFSTTAFKDRKYQTEGIADNLVSIQEHVESIAAMQEALAFWTAYPMFTLVPIGDEPIPIRGDWKFEAHPLGTVKAPPGYKWAPVQLPQLGPDIQAHREFLMNIGDQMRLAPILYGQIEHETHGPMGSVLLDNAKSRFNVATENWRGAWNEQAAFLLYCVDKILRKPVPTTYYVTEDDEKKKHGEWIELDPKDIKGYYVVDHQFSPTTQLERSIREQRALSLYQNKLYPKRKTLDESGEAQPGALLEEMAIEELADSPEARAWLAGEMLTIAEAKVAIQGEGTPENLPGGPSGGGVPNLGNVGAPLMPRLEQQTVAGPQSEIPPGMSGMPPQGVQP